jgi:phosphohistidine phosphatase
MPNDDVLPVMGSLQGEYELVMLVGHLPFLSRLASLLMVSNTEAGIIRFQQAGIVCLSQVDGKWAVNWVMPPDLLSSSDAPR